MCICNFFKRGIFLVYIFCIFILCNTVYGSSHKIVWNSIETKHAVINYQSLKDLAKFNKEVKYGDNESFSLLFFGIGEDKLIKTVSQKVDLIYERAQEILDMQRRIKKVRINIYHDKKQLNSAYSKIYNEPCNIRAWYIFDKNTVYVNADDLHEGMLAHELAHSIIDHYLLMSPPAASAEILARYVDKHLHNSSVVGSLKKPRHTLSSFSEE